jgi:hypothetical protein
VGGAGFALSGNARHSLSGAGVEAAGALAAAVIITTDAAVARQTAAR